MEDFEARYARLAERLSEVYDDLTEAYRTLLTIPVTLPAVESAKRFEDLGDDIARAALLLLDLPCHIVVKSSLQQATWNWLAAYQSLLLFRLMKIRASELTVQFMLRNAQRDLVVAVAAADGQIPEPPDLY